MPTTLYLPYQKKSLICHFNDDGDVGVDGVENCLYNDDKYDGQQQKLGISIWQKGKSALSN
ncbi:hypothetical protein [Avrilella dinanensis]|uniref:Uncharacterized protein n=1 Tax=Avrilella dinanensis TaxID=2008672 RepID=A0A2M9R717_9FLAO|nr:hypothetical protein [Avrilella dinanensis]PJR04644.1 hypothetical protein CDL10_08915 [Avrilella dinanensis]